MRGRSSRRPEDEVQVQTDLLFDVRDLLVHLVLLSTCSDCRGTGVRVEVDREGVPSRDGAGRLVPIGPCACREAAREAAERFLE